MKVAVLIQCHNEPERLFRLIDVLNYPDFNFFIHVDKKSNMDLTDWVPKYNNVFLLGEESRVSIKWGTIA